MEFRCEKCSHVGQAASISPSADGLVLVCAHCAHPNILETSAAGSASSPGQLAAESGGPKELEKIANINGGAGASAWLTKDAFEAMLPRPGPGERCLKCAHLLHEPGEAEPDPALESCPRCGLSRSEGARYAPGEAPWERPPVGKEAESERAELLWQAALNEDTGELSPDKLQKFVDFVGEEELLDQGIRKLRWYLTESPDDPDALKYLRELAGQMQSRLAVATAQAEADARYFERDIRNFKHRAITFSLVIIGVLLLLLLVLQFLGK